MSPARRRLRPLLLGLTLLGVPASPAPAQQVGRPDLDARTLVGEFLLGRYRSPVTCIRKDGSRLDLEEAVVIRRAPEQGGLHTLRATFFGIDVEDVTRCYDVRSMPIPDRRGVLYLTSDSPERSDLGMLDFKRALRHGELRYPIRNGKLHQRPIDTGAPAERRVFPFRGQGAVLVIRQIPAGSDVDRALDRHESQHPRGSSERPGRRLELSIEGREGLELHLFTADDPERGR